MKKVEGYQMDKQQGSIYLNANESYENVSPQILDEIHEAIDEIAFQRYPDETNSILINAYAKAMNLDPNCILAGHGSDEMLGFMIGNYLGKDKVLYTLNPDFSMYDYYAQIQDATIVKFDCNEDGSFDVDAFIKKGKEVKPNMILFSNPNNPTGFALSNKELKKIATAFDDIPFIVDEAYGEFNDESMLSEINNYQNLYVTRTLSKAYGLASMRVGFIVGKLENIQNLKPMIVPYNINTLSQKIGSIVLDHANEYQDKINLIKKDRDMMYEQLSKLDVLKVYPSKANYLFGRSEYKDKILKKLNDYGIVIRNYAKNDTFRITVGSSRENELVLKILKELDGEVKA